LPPPPPRYPSTYPPTTTLSRSIIMHHHSSPPWPLYCHATPSQHSYLPCRPSLTPITPYQLPCSLTRLMLTFATSMVIFARPPHASLGLRQSRRQQSQTSTRSLTSSCRSTS
jgi:hypothetical protein